MTASCLYSGEVVHVRHRPVHHRLVYRVFMGLFDLDELPDLGCRSRLFGYNRPGVLSLHDKDHGDGSGNLLRPQIEGALAAVGISSPGGPIRLLCMPRVLNFVFNPLSIYFCHDDAGTIRAVVHEVNNTFGERHLYALPAGDASTGKIGQDCAKQFRVSPFLPMNLDYHFEILPPSARTSTIISVRQDGRELMMAAFNGRRHSFSGANLLRQWLSHPTMTLKVILAIHWEALALWSKLRRQSAVGELPGHPR